MLDQIGNHQRSTPVGFPTHDVDHLHIAAMVIDVVAANWCFQVSVWVCVELDDVENFALSLEHDLCLLVAFPLLILMLLLALDLDTLWQNGHYHRITVMLFSVPSDLR